MRSTAPAGPDDAGTAHRPWRPPPSPWVLSMGWEHLAFLHWPVEAASLRPHIPAGLELDTHQGQAWLGVTPFRMSRVRPRLGPPIPGVSTFLELNVRTYVSAEDKPGIWFFSLDAGSRLAVRAARFMYGLPYFHASMSMGRENEAIHYRSRRVGETHHDSPRLRVEYHPTGPVQPAADGSLEQWLVERYCLYTTRARRLYRGEIHHAPWPLQSAQARVRLNTMTEPLGIELQGEPRVHYARRLDVVAWLPEAVD